MLGRPPHSLIVCVLTAISAFPDVALSRSTTPWKIDEATAVHLVGRVIGARHERWLEPEPYMTDHSFFVFDGLNKPPVNGSFGFFAVNRWTGDVWALWGCHRLTFPALRRSQTAIRRRFTRTETRQYARLRRLKPGCVVED